MKVRRINKIIIENCNKKYEDVHEIIFSCIQLYPNWYQIKSFWKLNAFYIFSSYF